MCFHEPWVGECFYAQYRPPHYIREHMQRSSFVTVEHSTDQHKHDVPNRHTRKCPDALFLRRAQLPHDKRSLVRAQLPILAISYPELQPRPEAARRHIHCWLVGCGLILELTTTGVPGCLLRPSGLPRLTRMLHPEMPCALWPIEGGRRCSAASLHRRITSHGTYCQVAPSPLPSESGKFLEPHSICTTSEAD